MARLRFPGRPGCRFERQGIRYAPDEAVQSQDPVLAWVANIHRGLRLFRELCGDSDEEEEFEGFTIEDVKKAEKKLEHLEAELYQENEPSIPAASPDTSFSPGSQAPTTMYTRFSKQKDSIENLPMSKRTRNLEQTVVPRSYRDMITKGITKPSKSYLIKSRKEFESPRAETRKALKGYYVMQKTISPDKQKFYEQGFKIKSSGRFRGSRIILGVGMPKYLSLVTRKHYIPIGPPASSEDSFNYISPEHKLKHLKKRKERDKKIHVISTMAKKGNQNIAKTLLNKAKKGKEEAAAKKAKHKTPVKKQFVMPTQSSRSSRVIIPTKRFIEMEETIGMDKKKKENLFDTSLSPSFRQPFISPTSQKSTDNLTIQTEFPHTSGFGSFSPSVYRKASLFDQPLITEGKRERKPSQKVKMIEGRDNEFGAFSPEEGRKVHLTPSKLGQTLSPPIRIAPPKFGSTPFRSLTQQSTEIVATKRSGHNILRKAKLQLNRAALNRSKAALAKSLKKEMKKEERNKKILDESAQGYSTYTAASTNYMDLEGPENDPELMSGNISVCLVCGRYMNDRKKIIRGTICTSCYRCYTRNPQVSREPCQNQEPCDTSKPSKTFCRPCKFRKACTVYHIAAGKKCPKFNIKKPRSSLTRPRHALEHGRKPLKFSDPRRSIEGLQNQRPGNEERRKSHDGRSSQKRPFDDKANHEKIPPKKQPTYLEMLHKPVGELMDLDEPPSPPSSPVPDIPDHTSDVTSSPESHVSPVTSVRGPRIKHVCRKAAVVLGKTVARFPQPELTLSALPKVEKKKLLKQDELDKAAYSDDEKTIEEIIQEAEEGVDTFVRSPPIKVQPKLKTHKTPPGIPISSHPNPFMKKSKRKLRCRKCKNCLAPDCGNCRFCLDKPKFGGRGVMKQACMKKTCLNPHYFKQGTALVKLKDGYDNPGSSSDCGAELNNNNNSNATKACLNVLGRFSQRTKSQGTQSQQTDSGNEGPERTVADISRQLRFGESSHASNHQLTNISKASKGQSSGRMATKIKMPMMQPNRSEFSLTQQTRRRSSYLWTKLKTEDESKHRLKADYREKYTTYTAWQFGVSLTVANPLCCRTVCFLCGSAGKHEFYYCNVCCEPFHDFCLEDNEKPSSDNLENWICKKCQFCTVCGQQKNLLKCDKCQNTYHPECLGPNYPTKPSKKKNIWVCTKCVKCKSCGATTPGTTSNATWTYDFQLCHICGQLMDKGNFCPICHKCYSDDDWDCKMVQCAKCDSWVHATCEGLSDEMYERVSCLPDDVHYICRMCSAGKLRHWEIVLRDDFMAGIKSIFYSIYNAKCSQFLDVESKKSDEDKLINVDESSNDSVSTKDSASSRVSSANMETPKPSKPDAIISCDNMMTPIPSILKKKENVIENFHANENLTNSKSDELTQNSSIRNMLMNENVVAMETDDSKGSNSFLNCDSQVVNVCDSDKDEVTSKPSDEPDGNKSLVVKTSPNVEQFIKNLEGLVRKRTSPQVSPNQTSAINDQSKPETSTALPTSSGDDNSIRLSIDSNSSSSGSQTEIKKTPEKKGAVVRFQNVIPDELPSRAYPKDLLTVRQKIIAGGYITVEEFSEDIANIIEIALTGTEEQSVVRKKAINSVRSIFVKQMEKCFPWYNVKGCRMWEHNRLLPKNMLPQAVVPPFDDHTYAQWREREDKPSSPQPSPFKKMIDTPVKKLFPIVDPDEEGEKVLTTDLADDGHDTRRCILCWHYGDADPNREGRLLYTGQDDWVHVNCALWSAEVYEEGKHGGLQNVPEAVSRGKKMKCDTCQRTGATVGCNTRGCPANYHFMCGRLEGCLFQEDKKIFCPQHKDRSDGLLVEKDKFAVLRRVSVDRENLKITKKSWTKGLTAAEINILIGSCTIESLGHLTALSDCKGVILPVGFCSSRVYWSTKDSRRRCVYTCRIVEYRPESLKSPEATIKDMTIIHDINHPNYVPLSKLDIPGINLFPNRKRANIIDITDEDVSILSVETSRTMSATSSIEKDRTKSFTGDESLSSSWPAPNKKRRSDPVPLDLSLLSPTTLRLLNKDPEKYKREVSDTETIIVRPPQPALPVIDENPLAQIASRLNSAAAKSRQKSEDRVIPGKSKIVIPERPASAPTLVRSRSNSVERVMSPPQLCSSPNVLPQVAEMVNDEMKMADSQNEMSMEMNESLESIIKELSSGDENAIIVISDHGELSEEDYSMIAQYTMGAQENRLTNTEAEVVESTEDEVKAIQINEAMDTEYFDNSKPLENDHTVKPESNVVSSVDQITQNKQEAPSDVQNDPAKSNSLTSDQATEVPPGSIKVPNDRNLVLFQNKSKDRIILTKEGTFVQHIDKEKVDKQATSSDEKSTIERMELTGCSTESVDIEKISDLTSSKEIPAAEVAKPCAEVPKADNSESTILEQVRGYQDKTEESKLKRDCPVLEKVDESSDSMSEETEAMPVLVVESPMKHKLNASADSESARKVLDLDMVNQSVDKEVPMETKPVEETNQICQPTAELWALDKQKEDESSMESEEKVYSPPKNFDLRDSGKFILHPETGDFVPKPDSPEKKMLSTNKSSSDSRKEKTKERNLFETLATSPVEKNDDDESKKADLLKGLGLEKTPPKPKRKSYPLRRRSIFSDEEYQLDVSLHEKLSEKIKAESLSKSTPGEEGPFKCQTCKRHYRTKESYSKHVKDCDFEVSSTTDEEEEKEGEGSRRGRYPMRESTIVQSVVSQVDEIERKSGVRKPGRTGSRDMSPKVLLDRLSPSRLDTKKSAQKESDLTSPTVKRGRGRPPKLQHSISIDSSSSTSSKSKQDSEKEKPVASNTPTTEKRGRGRPPLNKTPVSKNEEESSSKIEEESSSAIEISEEESPEKETKRSRGRPPKEIKHKGRGRPPLSSTQKVLDIKNKYRKPLRSRSDDFITSRKHRVESPSKSDNPYARQYLFKNTSVNYNLKQSLTASKNKRSLPLKKLKHLKESSRRKSDVSESSPGTRSVRKSSNESSSSLKTKEKEDEKEKEDDELDSSLECDKEQLEILASQIKRKRGRPRKSKDEDESCESKTTGVNNKDKESSHELEKSKEKSEKDVEKIDNEEIKDKDGTSEKEKDNSKTRQYLFKKKVEKPESITTGEVSSENSQLIDKDTSEKVESFTTGKVSSENSQLIDKEIKQEMLDSEYEAAKPKDSDKNSQIENAAQEKAEEEKSFSEGGTQTMDSKESPDSDQVLGCGTANMPFIIDDDFEDIHVQEKTKKHQKYRTPRKSDENEFIIKSVNGSPAVKALSSFLAKKEASPPKKDNAETPSPTTAPSLESIRENFSKSLEGKSEGSVLQQQLGHKKQHVSSRRVSDDARNSKDISSGASSPRSRHSSGHSEERNIFQVMNKTSPSENKSAYSAIKPAAEFVQPSTKLISQQHVQQISNSPSLGMGPPPLMTPSLIGIHNPANNTGSPASSLTAFQQLQQNMPQAIQQIQRSSNTPAIIPYVPAVQPPPSQFDINQHIERMIHETTLAAGSQNPVIQQIIQHSNIGAHQLVSPQMQQVIVHPKIESVPAHPQMQQAYIKPEVGPFIGHQQIQQIVSQPQVMVQPKIQQMQQMYTNPVMQPQVQQIPQVQHFIQQTQPQIQQVINPQIHQANVRNNSSQISQIPQTVQNMDITATPVTKASQPSSFIPVSKIPTNRLIPLTQLMDVEPSTSKPSSSHLPRSSPMPIGTSHHDISRRTPTPQSRTPTPQGSSSSSPVTPTQKTGGAKPNTIVRIFVDGKPVALTTDPTVLQDHKSLLNKLGGSQIQSGTYSVTVSAHRVPSTNTSPVTASSQLVPAIQQILPRSQSPASASGTSPKYSITSAIKDAIDMKLVEGMSRNTVSAATQEKILSSLISKQHSMGSHHNYSKSVQDMIRRLPMPERPTPTISIQPKVTTSYVKKPDGTVQKKTLIKPMIVNRKRPAINPISLMGSASKKPMVNYQEKNGTVQGLLSKVVMRKLVKDGSPKPKQLDDIERVIIPKEKRPRGRPAMKKKTPRKSNIHKPHAGVTSARPIVHGPKQVTKVPQPAVEEEVTESSMSVFMEHQQRVQEKAEKIEKNGAYLMFEITSDDGFSCKAETMEDAWQQVTEKVQDARTEARMKHLSCASVHGVNMFGVNHNAVVYLLEQLYGAQLCRNYNFRYHKYTRTEEDEEPIENPTGSARSEGYQSRKEFDIFSFLMSQYRAHPVMDLSESNTEMNLKSQRRATSMDLPMAMRFRKLKEHAREAVGVYRSSIHGRGLYCKRRIDAGEMIIEYSGEVIRATLTDKREKYYESKGIGCYMFRIDDQDVVDATLHGSAARFINHSCDPNCYSKVIQVEGKKHIVIFAMRQIFKGEELTYDYKFPIEEVKIPCTCGSRKCRKYLN